MSYTRAKEDVPASIIFPSDPEDQSPEGDPVEVEFDWRQGTPESGRYSGPPEDYDPGEPDEFVIVSPPLDEETEERVIEWLESYWERPTDSDRDDVKDWRE